jgi:hypothetical protein
MRRVVVVSVALVGGCFTELPMQPGTGSETTTATASSGTGESSTSATSGTSSSTATSGPAGDTDVDPPTTTGATTEGPAEEGLFACVMKLPCGLWDCTEGCDEPGPEGMCVLTALRERTSGPLEIARCDKNCALHVVIPRGSGTEEVQWQSRTQADPTTYSELRGCVLQPPEFFAGCLMNFGPDCADPAKWVVDCAEAEPICVN